MNDLTLVTTENFETLPCDFFQCGKEYVMTREQIGTALGYGNPVTAIKNIHNKHRDRCEQFSTRLKVSQVEGERTVVREAIVYTRRGIMEICRWSRQPKADAFMDFCWDVMERLMKGDAAPQPDPRIDALTEQVKKLAESVTALAGREIMPMMPAANRDSDGTPGRAARKRWFWTLNEKLDLLENKYNVPKNRLLHHLYLLIEEQQDVLLDEERIRRMEINDLEYCSTLEAIFYNRAFREQMQRNIDANLAPENRGW